MVELRFESRNIMRTFGVDRRHSIVEQQILSYRINGHWRDQVLDGKTKWDRYTDQTMKIVYTNTEGMFVEG